VLVSRVVNKLPQRVLEKVEILARRGQGKGWGASTTAEEVRAAISLLASPRHEIVAFDVGANVGNWTEAFLSQSTESVIYAFEPSESAARQFQETFGTNPRVRLIRQALGATEGQATLYSNESGSELASLTRRRLDHFGLTFSVNEIVDVATLDSWTARNNVLPNILKIDVEGHELDVLTGGLETLKSVEVVQFEFGGCHIDTRIFFQDFYYFFIKQGFRLHRLGPKGLSAITKYSESDEVFETTNFFAQRIGA
jgi:FkbM family methyltransferase